MKGFAEDSRLIHLTPLDSVRHAGATLAERSWAVLTTEAGPVVIYLHSLCQFDGCIKKHTGPYSYEAGHVMMQCFPFTFKQLRVQTAGGNRLTFTFDRLVQLLQYHRDSNANQHANQNDFPFVLTSGDMPYGTWSWHMKSLYDIISSSYRIRPMHWSGVLGEGQARMLTFTFR